MHFVYNTFYEHSIRNMVFCFVAVLNVNGGVVVLLAAKPDISDLFFGGWTF